MASSLKSQSTANRQPSFSNTENSSAPPSAPSQLPNTDSTSASKQIHTFRRLVWDATIPIVITVDAIELPDITIDRSIETYYVRAPRISYLPLILETVKNELLGTMLDDASLDLIRPEKCSFIYDGTPLRWHWPIGLLYDFHTANTAPTVHRSSPTRPSSETEEGEGRHDILRRGLSNVYVTPKPPIPWRLSLRIGTSPTDKVNSTASLDQCRASFMSMIKEADFVRFGSTKRVTNLRKAEQDAMWEGVMEHDFDKFWPVASKLMPLLTTLEAPASSPSSLSPSRAPSISSKAGAESSTVDRFGSVSSQNTVRASLMHQLNDSQASLYSAAPSESNMSVAESSAAVSTKTSSGNFKENQSYRSLPMRFHLAQGAPIVQEPVAPYTEEGRPITLRAVLSALFPLLFPPTPTFSASSTSSPPTPLAYAVIQGIRIPLEAEIAWIGAALPSADGWVAVCVHLLAEGEQI